jgi:ABC-type uncharacterized transport system fused permease/ATPase subunit
MEGYFRYAHARLRSYAESIAFYGGEKQELDNIAEKFENIVKNQTKLNKWQAVLSGTIAI